MQDHATTTDGHFRGIRHELSETSARLVALDEANDRMVSQLQESTTTFANMERRLGDAMGSADSNFAATIQQLRDDAARQAQAHEQQMQQLHEMFMRLSSQLVGSQATPQPPPPQQATTSAPSQQPPQPSSSSAPPPPPPNNVPQAGAKPEVKNDVTGSWASIHATLPRRQFSSGGSSSGGNSSDSSFGNQHPRRQKKKKMPIPVMKLPRPSTRFTGKGKPVDVEAWLFSFDHYFSMDKTIKPSVYVSYAALLLEDDALLWFRTEKLNNRMPNDWSSFCDVFRARWLPTNSTQLRRRAWANCSQHGSVAQFTQAFLNLMDGAGFIHETESLNRYIEALKPPVTAHLHHEQPKSLDEAIHLAEHFDGSYGEASPFRVARRGGSSVISGPHSLTNATSPIVNSRPQSDGLASGGPSPMEVDNTERFRHKRNGQASGLSSKKVLEENRCFRCYEKGHFGRDCPTFKDYTPKNKSNGGRYNNNNNGGQRFSRPHGKGRGKN